MSVVSAPYCVLSTKQHSNDLTGVLVMLPPCAAVQLGLYEVNPSGGASVRYVQLLEDDIAPTALELEDAVPLSALLAPVGEAKESIVTALESLQSEPFDAPLKGALTSMLC